MNKPLIGELQSSKPKAVLVYKEDGLLIEGLIFGETTKTVSYENREYRDFEYNYCKECSYYVAYEDENRPLPIVDFVDNLLFELSMEKFSKVEKISDESYERCVSRIVEIDVEEDIRYLIEDWNNESDYIFRYSVVELTNYIYDYDDWQYKDSNRHCEGGWSVVEEGDCGEVNPDYLGANTEYQIGLPDSIWLKLSKIKHPGSYRYYLLGMIPHNGYIMPPLAIGNVWRRENTFYGVNLVGEVCWGDIKPSSNIRIGYNQFWTSLFNYDRVGSDIDLSQPEDYGKLLLKRIKESIADKGYVKMDYKYNIILENGRLKKGVQIHKL